MTTPTKSEKRIAIAEGIGWTKVGEKGFGSKDLVGCRPKETFWAFTPLPDYEKDLNACNEAENALSEVQHVNFYDALWITISRLNPSSSQAKICRLCVSAPTALRAEAIWLTICKTPTP